MAVYKNLKDYFQNEHIKLIQDAIKNYLKDCRQIKNPVVRSLVCTVDDRYYNAKFEIGVSVDVVDAGKVAPRSFIVTLKGNIEQRFKDIKVIGVRSVNNASFPEDNILNQFILPDIPSEEVERIGSDLYKFYSKHDIFKESSLSIEKLVNKGMLYFSPLPDSCMGRIILSETDVEIIQNVETEKGKKSQKKTIHALFGTILLNYNKYAVELDGSLCVTVAHELVHLQFHSRFLKILQLLGEKDIELNSTTEPVALDENMTDIQKALCIAEWQANVLATRLAIPKCTVLTVINDIANDPSCRYANDGDRMQACVNAFAKRYNVSPYVAKERLRQLEYDFVDGTCIEVDGDNKKPFYFAPHTLNENETFVIDRAHYERLLQENKEFAELIYSDRYIYLEYVVCLLDAQYIDVEFTENGVKRALSDYARNHAERCLLKFKCRNANASKPTQYNYSSYYLNNIMPDFLKVIPESFELSEEDTGLDSKTIEQIKEFNDTMNMLNSPELKNSLANTIIYYMRKKEIQYNELKKRIKLSVTAIQNICGGITKNVDIRNVMALCIGLELDSEECYDMFEKAGYNVHKDTLRNRAYRFLFSCTGSGLDECNKILRYFHQDELPYHKGQ